MKLEVSKSELFLPVELFVSSERAQSLVLLIIFSGEGSKLNNSANVSNLFFQIGGGIGVLGYNKNCVAQKNFLDALASLDSKLSVSQSVIDVFRLAHLRVFQSYFI